MTGDRRPKMGLLKFLVTRSRRGRLHKTRIYSVQCSGKDNNNSDGGHGENRSQVVIQKSK